MSKQRKGNKELKKPKLMSAKEKRQKKHAQQSEGAIAKLLDHSDHSKDHSK